MKMKKGICARLAVGNLRKNYRFFIPRILAETGLLACFYIIFTLACDDRLASVKGGNYLPTFMWMGAVIIGLLSFVLILYSNSFLMKQRKREFGLYSVLGMEKKHICRVLFHESFFCCLLSIVSGLLFGILFYKVSSLAICRLLRAQIIAGFYFISPATVIPSGLIFLGIDAFAFFVNCVTIRRMKPVDLLTGSSAGEKEPKVKWVLLIFGALFLGGGYAISLTTKQPLQAIFLFFAAVLLVIVGTYFLYVAGSIFVLKALKRNDRFYYRPGKITAVSGLLYRMKQNAVGLASVAILATGVLIMISSTFCLYSRTETVLKTNYPQDCYVPMSYYEYGDIPMPIPEEIVAGIVEESAAKHGLELREAFPQTFFEVTFSHRPGELITDRASIAVETNLSSLCNVTFITEETYVNLGGTPLGLAPDEVAVCSLKLRSSFDDERFTLCGRTFRTAKTLTTFPINVHLVSVNCYGMVVADDAVFDAIFEGQRAAYGDNASELQSRYCLTFADRRQAEEVGDEFLKDVDTAIGRYIFESGSPSFSRQMADSVWDSRESLYGMYGTLLFLGILLGLVCLFATVLIIYYKQISEGYEDRGRYQIMRKIGMTDGEVRRTIRSQVMLVFFLPLVTAGVHVVFAYPIVTRLMEILLLDNVWLFAQWCVIVYLVFAAVYALIYAMTAKTYYKIVD